MIANHVKLLTSLLHHSLLVLSVIVSGTTLTIRFLLLERLLVLNVGFLHRLCLVLEGLLLSVGERMPLFARLRHKIGLLRQSRSRAICFNLSLLSIPQACDEEYVG